MEINKSIRKKVKDKTLHKTNNLIINADEIPKMINLLENNKAKSYEFCYRKDNKKVIYSKIEKALNDDYIRINRYATPINYPKKSKTTKKTSKKDSFNIDNLSEEDKLKLVAKLLK